MRVLGPGVDARKQRSLTAIYRRPILAFAIGVAELVLLASLRTAPVYTSEVLVLIEPTHRLLPTDAAIVSLDTEPELARSIAVASAASRRLRDDPLPSDPRRLLLGLSVQPLEGTEILRFSYTHNDPDIARLRVQALAEAYLAVRTEGQQLGVIAQADALAAQIEHLEKRFRVMQPWMDAATERSSSAHLETEAAAVLDVLVEKELQLAELPDVDPFGTVVGSATVPDAPSGPSHPLYGGVGLFLGLITGIAYAALRFRKDDRILSEPELEASLNAPILGWIPRTRTLTGWIHSTFSSRMSPIGRNAEAYRLLRTNVVATTDAQQMRVLLVSSARAGEGQTVVAANLAVAIAQAGKGVALLSADTRNDQLSRLLRFPSAPSLADVLAHDESLQRALRPIDLQITQARQIFCLGSGNLGVDPAQHLASMRMVDVLEEITERRGVDFVLIDGPPVLGRSDTIALAPLADGVLLITNQRNATRATSRLVRKQLAHVNAPIIGIALTDVPSRRLSSVRRRFRAWVSISPRH